MMRLRGRPGPVLDRGHTVVVDVALPAARPAATRSTLVIRAHTAPWPARSAGYSGRVPIPGSKEARAVQVRDAVTALSERQTESGRRMPAVLRARLGAYVALTKPRIIELLLVTTVPAMMLAARGLVSAT